MILRPQPRASFEPPRAGAMRGVWNAWYAFLRRSRRHVPSMPMVLKARGLSWRSLAVVLIPTYGWIALGKPVTARRAAQAYAAAALVAIACLGLSWAGMA